LTLIPTEKQKLNIIPGEKMNQASSGQNTTPQKDQIILAGGCFWCIEAVFEILEGVETVQSGYTGGHIPNPSYEQVCSGNTGHAEAVRITFNPNIVSCSQLFEIFFASHDPTTLNRQGADTGPQYRSAIFYDGIAQKQIAESYIENLTQKGLWEMPIVTEVKQQTTFYPAEIYHSEYFRNNPYSPYCQYIIAPKVAKIQTTFTHCLKEGISR
jgi:peptide-methionine (S)-S-oxide reductase